MQDLWQGSDPDVRNFRDWRGLRRPALIAWWWAAYLGGNVLSFRTSGRTTLDELRQADQWAAVGCALTVVAAALAIVVVRAITERQEHARMAQTTQLPAAAAPGWYPDPTGRFDHRYWNGSAWTLHASRAGESVIDPLN
jgi:hypothetical protein